ESDHAPSRIVNREHDPVAEAIVALAALAGDDQSRRLERLALVVAERRREGRPVVGSIANPEASRDRPGQAPTLEVVDRAWAFLQGGAIELGRGEQQGRKVFGLRTSRLGFR